MDRTGPGRACPSRRLRHLFDVFAETPCYGPGVTVSTRLKRSVLRGWARSGRAPGWLYAYLERDGNRLSDGPIIKTLRNGLRMTLDLSDHVQRQIYFFGAYEAIELSLFSKLLEPGFTVIDAGANVGFYSLMLGDVVGKTGRVLAFEPVPQTYAQLRANLALNDVPQVAAVNQALWSARQPLTLNLARQQEHNIGGYSCADLPDAIEQSSCEAVRLDDVVREASVPRVDAIKMDIEGAERFALEGSRETIDRDRPYVLLEVCQATCERAGYSSQDLWSFFAGRKYAAFVIGATFGESRWVQDFSGIRQRNVLLVPPDRPRDLERWNERALRMAYV